MDHSEPDTFVLATGRNASVREFIGMAFAAIGIDLQWRREGTNEEGVCTKSGKVRVKVNPAFFRPAEVDELIGNPARAQRLLRWQAETISSMNCAG